MNGVDTNIFVYALDHYEPVKQAKALELLQRLRGGFPQTVILWQVMGEYLNQMRRWLDQGRINPTDYQTYIQVYRVMFPLELPTTGVIDRALDLARRYSLSHWDSMLLGACLEAGITTLYTEDMGAPRTIDSIQLVNPFI
jgi:predicted nucleic acid-binding protein